MKNALDLSSVEQKVCHCSRLGGKMLTRELQGELVVMSECSNEYAVHPELGVMGV
jgi:hypothetical protein